MSVLLRIYSYLFAFLIRVASGGRGNPGFRPSAIRGKNSRPRGKFRKAMQGRVDDRKEIKQHYSGLNDPSSDSAFADPKTKLTDLPRARSRILIHCASFGELEQAKPVIAGLRQRYPRCHLHLTFFSPSGYENAKGKYQDADFITYSPFDTKSEVREFLDSTNPDIALFTKYDVWPIMAIELQRRNIPTVLFSAAASKDSRRMQPILRRVQSEIYRSLSRIFTISEADKRQFESLGVPSERIVIAGDTRYDQVVSRKPVKAPLPDVITDRIESQGLLVFVVGSAWPADMTIIRSTLLESISRNDKILTIIVPHEVGTANVDHMIKIFGKSAITLSEIEHYEQEPVIVVDSIGKLFDLYAIADFAMIGGGFGAGLHNTLEAAVYGLPVIVGPNHQKTREVGELVEAGGGFEVSSAKEFEFVFWRLVNDEDLRRTSGQAGANFVQKRTGATITILDAVESLLQERS